MRAADTLRFAAHALTAARGRTGLMILAMAIGIGSVVLLTALGEGARRYVMDQFGGLGVHLIIVLPGRVETTGGPPPLLGATPQNLTLDDAAALTRSRHVQRVAPIIIGSAPVSRGGLEKEVTLAGTTAELQPVRNLEMGLGSFLPEGEAGRAQQVVVIGSGLRDTLFAGQNPLGELVRVHDRRFRVIGVLKSRGESMGMDLDDIALIPVAAAQSLFNTETLFRVLVQAQGRDHVASAKEAVHAILKARHDGEDDVTIITQDAMLSTFDAIFRALTLAVAGIAAISLGVAGILTMNVMLVAVSQRTAEIGLLKALGAAGPEVERLFLVEATLLSAGGGAIGVGLAYAGVWAMQRAFPTFPLAVPLWALGLGLGVAVVTGIVFGVLPARRAARLDPVEALMRR